MNRLFNSLDKVADYLLDEERNCKCEDHDKHKVTDEHIKMFRELITDDNTVVMLFTFTAYMIAFDDVAYSGFTRSYEGIVKWQQENKKLIQS